MLAHMGIPFRPNAVGKPLVERAPVLQWPQGRMNQRGVYPQTYDPQSRSGRPLAGCVQTGSAWLPDLNQSMPRAASRDGQKWRNLRNHRQASST
ncbi:hypothetical protein [Pseudoxanthomonas mexicana]|uniref:hypothetical protein n=1 Tax=Pseudoxanthomonas mexicana TaxID=128785 RepID=UPI003D2F700F